MCRGMFVIYTALSLITVIITRNGCVDSTEMKKCKISQLIDSQMNHVTGCQLIQVETIDKMKSIFDTIFSAFRSADNW